MKKNIVMSTYQSAGTIKAIYMKCYGYRELAYAKNNEQAKQAINKFIARMLDQCDYPDIKIEFSAVEENEE